LVAQTRLATPTLSALGHEMAGRGFDVKPVLVVTQLSCHVAASLGGLILFFGSQRIALQALGMLLSTAGSTGVGTNTHTSSHYATSRRRWVNEALTYFGYPFFLGLSATFWWHKHVVVHHPAPNIIGVDGDADFMPWLALTTQEMSAARGWRRFYYERCQWALFPVILAGNGVSMALSGWRHLLDCLADSDRRSARHWVDLGCLVAHFAANLALPMLFLPFPEAAGAYLLRITLMGYALFAVLGPGHLPPEAARLTPSHKHADYLLRQTATTVNFRPGRLGAFVCSGLQYQIEHHLFPHVSHVHYPAMSVIVRDFCQRHGLPYRSYAWPVALWKCWQTMIRPNGVLDDVEALRRSGEIGGARVSEFPAAERRPHIVK
jgi:fatty acid desaturase